MFGRIFGRASRILTKPAFRAGDVDGFWVWYFENADVIRSRVSSGQPPNKLLDEFADALAKIESGLVFELGIDSQDRLDVVLSGDGVVRVFPAVLALAKAAPATPGHVVTAFRQRKDVQIEVEGCRLSATDARYVSMREDDHVHVRVFIPLPGDDKQARARFGFLLLDCVLGEYDVATSLGGIEFAPISAAPDEARPLPELAVEVDAMNAARALQ